MTANELRIGNIIFYDGEVTKVTQGEFVHILRFPEKYSPLELTEENFLKFINWEFEKGFNIIDKSGEYWDIREYVMENIIDGSDNFSVQFGTNKKYQDTIITYHNDGNEVELGLEDTLHNFQNLFFFNTGQELPIKV